jgi:hypothetical protein
MKVLRNITMIVFGFALLLTSCDPKGTKLANEKVTEKNLIEIATKLKEDKSTTKEELDLFNSGLARLGGSKDSLVNKTVGQIIEAQKEFTRNNSANSLISISNKYEINNALQINILQKLMVNQDTIVADGVELAIKNNSDKEINEIKGEIQIFNAKNELVKVRPVQWKNFKVEAGKQITHREFWPHIKDNPNDQYLRNEKNLIGVWVPETITFADGKKMSVIVK